MSKKLNNIDWHCDQCNAYLNSQDGFNTDCGIWQCEECGFSNPINEDFVLSEEEYDSFISSGYIIQGHPVPYTG